MGADTNKLLVLKAYYLGHAIAQRKQSISSALAMVDAAITTLEKLADKQSKIRLLFYVLLKSEILREMQDVIDLRTKAKSIASEITGDIYAQFMAVEEATQTRKMAYGLQTGIVSDKGVQSDVRYTRKYSYTSKEGLSVQVLRYDAACRALGIDDEHLSDQERNFLHKVSLRQMLEKHEVSFTL